MMMLIPGWGKVSFGFGNRLWGVSCSAGHSPLFCHTMEVKSKQRTHKKHLSLVCSPFGTGGSYWSIIFPELPILDVHGLKQSARQKKISDTRVKNKSNVFKNITLNATTVQKFPGVFSVSPTTICALWKGQERLSLSPSCHLSLGSSPRECETNLQLLKTALPQILELPLSIGRETFPCRLWQHRKGEAMTWPKQSGIGSEDSSRILKPKKCKTASWIAPDFYCQCEYLRGETVS